jgi:hypothetical protein
MAKIRTLVEREATWSFGLASLGFLSLYTTLPAAAYLGFRTIRNRRGGDGSEPAIVALALGMAWISFLLGYPLMRAIVLTATRADDRWRAWTFAAGLLIDAVLIAILANVAVRIHPERWVARRAVIAGIVAAIVAAALHAFGVAVGASGGVAGCGSAFAVNADCLGPLPWATIGPAIAVGLLWFAVSILLNRLRRARRETGGPIRR